MSRKRWVCPTCGKGALGPQRPRRNATVRYCLPCSSKAGVLVERTCPSLEKAREAKRERAAARTRRKAEREKAAEAERWTWGGFDLRVEARRLCTAALPGTPVPELELRIRRSGAYTTGHSYGGRVVLTIHQDAGPHHALALLAHELAHEAGLRDGHGDGWRARFAACAAYYGAAVDMAEVQGDSAHDLHCAVEAALERVVVSEGRVREFARGELERIKNKEDA